MAAAAPTPSPFVASTRRFAPRLRSFIPGAAMSPAASSAPNPSSGAGEEAQAQAPPLPHSTLEIAGARRGLLSGFASLRAPYRAFPVLASNRHVETIFAAFTRSLPAVKLRRECLRVPDDGAVALDWVAGDDRVLPSDAPVLILLPGLTGGSDDTYVRHMLMRARSKGWRVVVFNSRGCAESPVTTPKVLQVLHIFFIIMVSLHVAWIIHESNRRYTRTVFFLLKYRRSAKIFTLFDRMRRRLSVNIS